MTTLEWRNDGNKEGGVTERQFVIKGGSGSVPGIMWSPEPAETPAPTSERLKEVYGHLFRGC